MLATLQRFILCGNKNPAHISLCVDSHYILNKIFLLLFVISVFFSLTLADISSKRESFIIKIFSVVDAWKLW